MDFILISSMISSQTLSSLVLKFPNPDNLSCQVWCVGKYHEGERRADGLSWIADFRVWGGDNLNLLLSSNITSQGFSLVWISLVLYLVMQESLGLGVGRMTNSSRWLLSALMTERALSGVSDKCLNTIRSGEDSKQPPYTLRKPHITSLHVPRPCSLNRSVCL